MTRPTTINANADIPAKTPRPIGRTWRDFPGTTYVVSASCCVERLAVGFELSAAAVAELDVTVADAPLADPAEAYFV